MTDLSLGLLGKLVPLLWGVEEGLKKAEERDGRGRVRSKVRRIIKDYYY